APPAPLPYREWNAGAGPPPRPELGHLCRESRRGGPRRAEPSRASRTGSTEPVRPRRGVRPALLLQRRAAAGKPFPSPSGAAAQMLRVPRCCVAPRLPQQGALLPPPLLEQRPHGSAAGMERTRREAACGLRVIAQQLTLLFH
ncbi:hypothetical protein Nmel_008033, partial [Mimus melanotis]